MSHFVEQKPNFSSVEAEQEDLEVPNVFHHLHLLLEPGDRDEDTGCFFGIGALVFEKVLSDETQGPIL